MSRPDFQRIFEAVPGAHLVLAPDLTIVAVSNAYLSATMTRREDIVGRGVFEAFPDNPQDPAATGVARLRESLHHVLADRCPHTIPVQKYEVRRPDGTFEVRHWGARNAPILDPDGGVAYVLHTVEDITDAVRLHEREARHVDSGQLLDSAPDAFVVIDQDSRIILVNVQAERIFGYARDELVGQRFDILLPERFRHGHGRHVAAFFAHPSARPMGSGLELFGRRKDGSDLSIEVSLSPLRSADGTTVSAVIRDITERKRLEAKVKLHAERLASAVETMEDGFAIFDDESRLVLCNSVYRALVGNTLEGSLVGRSHAELVDAWLPNIVFGDEEARARHRSARLAPTRTSNTFEITTTDGRTLRVADRATPEGGIVKTVWDLTEERRAAEELRDARRAAEAGSAAKTEFLSSMSHELRTPLNAILGFAQLLQRDKKTPLAERHRERVERILKGGEHLLRLIDDILDLSRIESGAVSISMEPVRVWEVLEDVLRTLEPIAARYRITVALDPPTLDLPMIAADRTRFAQILMNFGSNAIKYNRPGGRVVFRVEAVTEARVRISVVDTGFGIRPEMQEKLFQPFQRAGQETGPIEGTGIGLVITKQLAKLMNGTVGFCSTLGGGSTFWVEMPVHAPATQERGAGSTAAGVGAEAAPTGGAGRHVVLYVEDNPANVGFMRDLASTIEDIDLVTVPTAELGVELARVRQPALVVMDINLPGMSGFEALDALRGAPETRHIPIIALTAAASERDRKRGLEAGFYRYLTKPVNVDELVGALTTLLGQPAT